jgi:hypothetical protein
MQAKWLPFYAPPNYQTLYSKYEIGSSMILADRYLFTKQYLGRNFLRSETLKWLLTMEIAITAYVISFAK